MTTIIIPSHIAREIPADAMRHALALMGLTLDGKLSPRRDHVATRAATGEDVIWTRIW